MERFPGNIPENVYFVPQNKEFVIGAINQVLKPIGYIAFMHPENPNSLLIVPLLENPKLPTAGFNIVRSPSNELRSIGGTLQPLFWSDLWKIIAAIAALLSQHNVVQPALDLLNTLKQKGFEPNQIFIEKWNAVKPKESVCQ